MLCHLALGTLLARLLPPWHGLLPAHARGGGRRDDGARERTQLERPRKHISNVCVSSRVFFENICFCLSEAPFSMGHHFSQNNILESGLRGIPSKTKKQSAVSIGRWPPRRPSARRRRGRRRARPRCGPLSSKAPDGAANAKKVGPRAPSSPKVPRKADTCPHLGSGNSDEVSRQDECLNLTKVVRMRRSATSCVKVFGQ